MGTGLKCLLAMIFLILLFWTRIAFPEGFLFTSFSIAVPFTDMWGRTSFRLTKLFVVSLVSTKMEISVLDTILKKSLLRIGFRNPSFALQKSFLLNRLLILAWKTDRTCSLCWSFPDWIGINW